MNLKLPLPAIALSQVDSKEKGFQIQDYDTGWGLCRDGDEERERMTAQVLFIFYYYYDDY